MLVAPRVEKILAPNPGLRTGRGTNTYIVGGPDAVVIDPGPDIPAHVEAIVRRTTENGARVRAIVVTHHHPDHLPAATRLREQTGAYLAAHPTIKGVDLPLQDGQRVEVEGTSLLALYTPGHATDHLCFHFEQEEVLFTGDLVLGQGTVVVAPREGGDMDEYLDSLARVQRLPVRTILGGHGPVVDDARAKLEEYITHRQERERQVLGLLAEGVSRVPDLVERIYQAYDRRLFDLAEQSITAHLISLERRGLVRAAGARSRRRYSLTAAAGARASA